MARTRVRACVMGNELGLWQGLGLGLGLGLGAMARVAIWDVVEARDVCQHHQCTQLHRVLCSLIGQGVPPLFGTIWELAIGEQLPSGMVVGWRVCGCV